MNQPFSCKTAQTVLWSGLLEGEGQRAHQACKDPEVSFLLPKYKIISSVLNKMYLPSKSLSVYELKHIAGDVKHRPPVPFENLFRKEPAEKRKGLYLHSVSECFQKLHDYGWSSNLPPQEFSQKSVKHIKDEVHKEQTVQLLPYKVLPTLWTTRTPLGIRLAHAIRTNEIWWKYVHLLGSKVKKHRKVQLWEAGILRHLLPVNHDFLVLQQCGPASGNTTQQ